MKKLSLLVLTALLVLVCVGCTKSANPPSQSDSPLSQSSSVDTSPAPAQPPESEPPDEFLVVWEYAIPDGAMEIQIVVNDTPITMYLPANWTVDGAQILEDGRLVAEVHSATKITDKQGLFDSLDAEYSDAEYCREFVAPGMEGRYYHIQRPAQAVGFLTAFENELRYFICIGENVIDISFHPAFGIGILTQREEFEAYLVTLSL